MEKGKINGTGPEFKGLIEQLNCISSVKKWKEKISWIWKLGKKDKQKMSISTNMC